MTPVFGKDTHTYDVIVNSSVTNVEISASSISNTATVSGTGNIALNGGTTEAKIKVQAQNGDIRKYTIRIVQSANGPMPNAGSGSNSQTGTGSQGPSSGSTNPSDSAGSSNGGPGVPDSSGGLTEGNTDGPGGSSVTVIN